VCTYNFAAPERILLGTVDTMAFKNWLEWRLLPGPTLIEPRVSTVVYERVFSILECSMRTNLTIHMHGLHLFFMQYPHEHGQPDVVLYTSDGHDRDFPDSMLVPSLPGTGGDARGNAPKVELWYPRFLFSDENEESRHEDFMAGHLFYAVKGGQSIAVSALSLNITAYLNAVPYRHRDNIEKDVLNATALALAPDQKDGEFKRVTALITGTGRSGTTYMCKLFRKAGIKISHDNNYDCGPYPSEQGAASWYDAFYIRRFDRRYDTINHIVRYPVDVINSRALKLEKSPSMVGFLRSHTQPWEDGSDIDFRPNPLRLNETMLSRYLKWSLKHWVRRNSFVSRYAEWRESTEDVSGDPMFAWRLCLASYFDCPSLLEWRKAVAAIDPTINTQGNSPKLVDDPSKKKRLKNPLHWDWDQLSTLGPVEEEYVLVARQMAYEYGYDEDGTKVHGEKLLSLQDPGWAYRCGWTKPMAKWECSILRR